MDTQQKFASGGSSSLLSLSTNKNYTDEAMNPRLPGQSLVYAHCHSIFKGVDAKVRKNHSIKHLLQKNQNSIASLLREFSLDALCVVAKGLLHEGVFEYTARARLRFPELFRTTPTETAKKAALDIEAAKNEVDALIEAAPEVGEEMISHPNANFSTLTPTGSDMNWKGMASLLSSYDANLLQAN